MPPDIKPDYFTARAFLPNNRKQSCRTKNRSQTEQFSLNQARSRRPIIRYIILFHSFNRSHNFADIGKIQCLQAENMCQNMPIPIRISKQPQLLLIILINQVHHHLRHHVLFFRAALGNHQRQGDQCIVIQKARTVSTVKNPIVFQEPKEQESGDTLVTVAELMVLNRQIEQIAAFSSTLG